MAVIATYRPTAEILDRVATVQAMVDSVVVADDASPCTYDQTLRSLAGLPKTSLVRFATNEGIARSLNAGLQHAVRKGATWLLTLDQDTDLPPDYLVKLTSDLWASREHGVTVGVLAPERITDVQGTITYPTVAYQGWPTTHEVMQSGALWSISALQAVGGFDEELGMDAVDAAACLSLRENGYQIALSPSARIFHQWGDAQYFSVFGRTVASTGHSAKRRRSITRNRIVLFPREFRQSPVHALRTMRRLASSATLAATAEGDRRAKLRATISGLLGSKYTRG